MRVIQVAQFGGPEVLTPGEAPDPVAGPGEAVIAVSAADVLFLDTQIRSGSAGGYFAVKPPYVPGGGVAGRVVSVGPGVDPGWTGRRVVTRTGGPGGQGGYAQMAMAPVDGLVQVPDSLGLSEAAALLHDGPTALGLAGKARLEPGDWPWCSARPAAWASCWCNWRGRPAHGLPARPGASRSSTWSGSSVPRR